MAESLQMSLVARVHTFGRTPALDVLVSQSDKTTEQFVASKKRVGRKIGIDVRVVRLGESSSTSYIDALAESVQRSDGVVVQLPLLEGIEQEQVFTALPASHDVDGIGSEAVAAFAEGTAVILPPVVGAMREILKRHNVVVSGARVLVVGEGRLVGKPAAVWFARHGATVNVANRETANLGELTRESQIIVLGAGVPGLLQPEMVSQGTVVLDAGTSESGGRVVGDAASAVAEKARLFTPTPGGIGPVAVTMIFTNLLTLIEKRL